MFDLVAYTPFLLRILAFFVEQVPFTLIIIVRLLERKGQLHHADAAILPSSGLDDLVGAIGPGHQQPGMGPWSKALFGS